MSSDQTFRSKITTCQWQNTSTPLRPLHNLFLGEQLLNYDKQESHGQTNFGSSSSLVGDTKVLIVHIVVVKSK